MAEANWDNYGSKALHERLNRAEAALSACQGELARERHNAAELRRLWEPLGKRAEAAEAARDELARTVEDRITLWESHGDAKLAPPYSHLTVVGELKVIRDRALSSEATKDD